MGCKGYYGHTFFDENVPFFEHRAKYGTAGSTVSEKGTDNKKNNSSEYNREYYEKHKDKWQKGSEDYDKNKDKWAKEGQYDPNGDDEDFKKVYGDDLKNPKLNMDTHIKGTDFYQVTNKEGQVVLINGDKKWTLPKGVKVDASMIQKLSAIDSHGGKQTDGFKMAMNDFLEDARKKTKSSDSSKKSSGDSKPKSNEKKTSSKKTFDEAKADYYEKKNEKTQSADEAANKKGKKQTEYYKKKTVKHYDDIGSILISDLY